MASKNIVLVGFMGTGKTSVGKILAEKLKARLIDVDQVVEKTQAESIPEIFEKHGEPYFRELERKAIAE
ncbi:MAG: AAA family ATPase, partial [Candidatus Omnitrophica bacterium]|nr:AAA family ATPase [Candidatus Omnitrophota bacterium]